MPKIDLGGISLHYVEQGEGKALFLLHGNAGSWRVWRKAMPELGRRYRLVAHDRQGFGDSEEGETGDYGPRAYARELLGVMDALGVRRAHVCGLSMGGMIAQCFAIDYPQRLDGLVLVGTMPDRTGRNVAATLAELHRVGWRADAERLSRSWFRAGADAGDIAEAHEIALRSSQRMRERTVVALGDFDIRAELPRIQAPTLILNGGQDTTNPATHAEIMRDGIPGARLLTIPDCGHLIPVEQPEHFCRHVLSFLGEVDGRAR